MNLRSTKKVKEVEKSTVLQIAAVSRLQNLESEGVFQFYRGVWNGTQTKVQYAEYTRMKSNLQKTRRSGQPAAFGRGVAFY